MTEGGPHLGGRLPGEEDLLDVLLDGRYHTGSVLGRGGMAVVYDAIDERFGRAVVVKVPRHELLRDPGFRQRFDTEIRSQVDLDHPGIAKVLDRGEHAGTPFVVIQRLGGGSLASRARQSGGKQTPEEILQWLHNVAGILDFMHERGMVHRDVKPGNILFDEEGHVFLADFGIVKALGRSDGTLTMTGIVPGTPNYMAPEQARGTSITGLVDQYALASTVYEMLAGRLPYEKGTPVIVLASKQIKDPASLRSVEPSIARPVAAVVMRALARKPQDRYASCGEFAHEFEKAIDGAEAADAAARAMKLPMPWLILPTLGLLVLVLAGLVIMMLSAR